MNFDTKINESGFNEGINKLGSLGKSGLSVVSKAMTGAVAAVGAGAAAIVKSSLGVVANMEQQVGGVETLFKDSAKTVIRNANNAFKTAQLSANDYMSTVTSFSASLLQGLGGDTAKAAEIADMAIIDMADNANKMGTNMQDIQNAYQGFAKQNYTMLDNLKLGYGGTQSEMIRLINDSGILNEKIEDLDNVTFDQMIQAIHKVQQNLGITGTSAKEASTTIEGSVNSAKAAWENFEAGVISANDLVDTFWIAAKNILNNLGQMIPRLGKTGMDVVESLSGKIGEAVPQLKGLTDSVGKLADKLQNMSTDELMNLGKTAAVLAGAGPVISLFGSQIGNVQSAVSGFSGLTTGVLSELGKLPNGFKSATKSAVNFRKDFTGSLKGIGSAVTGPFQVLTPKLSATVGKIGITHNTYGTHVGQGCEVLVYFFVQAGFGDFFAPDGVCVLYHLYFFCGYIADDTDTKSWTREWLTEYQVIRDAEFQTGFSYFIFEQVTQRLDDLFEIYVLRQTAYVVMRFDYGGFSANTTFYNIRIDSSLYQEVHSSDFLCFFFKYTDEFLTDNFSLCFRFFHAFQFLIETFLCVDPDKVQVIIAVRTEDRLYFIAFVLSQKTMVYEYAGQLIANCFG